MCNTNIAPYNITIASSLNEDSRVHWCSRMPRCLHIVFRTPAAVKLWAARTTSDTLHIALELIFHHCVFRNLSLLPIFEAPTFSYTISHGRWDPRFQNLGPRCEGIFKTSVSRWKDFQVHKTLNILDIEVVLKSDIKIRIYLTTIEKINWKVWLTLKSVDFEIVKLPS